MHIKLEGMSTIALSGSVITLIGFFERYVELVVFHSEGF